jgi:hypothetical protein
LEAASAAFLRMLADEKAHFTFTLWVKASLTVFSEKKQAWVASLGARLLVIDVILKAK